MVTYAAGSACADLVGQAVLPPGVAHEDGGLDLVDGAGRDGDRGVADARTGIPSAAKGVIHDLTTLPSLSFPHPLPNAPCRSSSSYLGVSDQDDLGVGTPLVERVDLASHGGSPLPRRVAVRHATAGRLAAAGRVGDGLGGGAGVRADDHVDELARGAIAGRDGGLTSAEDVEVWALGCDEGRLRRDEQRVLEPHLWEERELAIVLVV